MTTADPGRTANTAARPAATLPELLYGLTHVAHLSRLPMGQIASSRNTPVLHIEVPAVADVARWAQALQLGEPERREPATGGVCTALHFSVVGWSVHLFHNNQPGGPRT